MSQSDYLILDGLSKRFDGGAGVRDVSLSLARGEILALLGPSGSGKTTTLRLLAGFEQPDAGRIVVNGADVTTMAPVARRFGMVFQHYALFPHLTVAQNVAFGLESLKLGTAALTDRVEGVLRAVDLAGYGARSIASLSGGQQQRVAVARALAPEPPVLLLDEPLSNLDPSLRERTRRELRELIQRIGITTVLVTHEQEEAFDLADRIAVLHAGRLDQLGTPDQLYRTPATPFVAGFIGRATLIDADLTVRQQGGLLTFAGQGLEVPLGAVAAGPVRVAVRPEAFRLRSGGAGRWSGQVVARRYLGNTALLRVALDGAGLELEVEASPEEAAIGERVGLEPTGKGLHIFAGALPG
ncbi:MAG: ABC transporter ATP-binding protein [Gemmatimonadales bacterium]|nr:ABC transporter ATP-binding protein [Gemmatimonadales bacterium]